MNFGKIEIIIVIFILIKMLKVIVMDIFMEIFEYGVDEKIDRLIVGMWFVIDNDRVRCIGRN